MVPGRVGSATIFVFTATDEEFPHARDALKTTEQVPGKHYFVRAGGGGEGAPHDVVLGQCDQRTNLPAYGTTRDAIEDWRPSYIFLMGTAGSLIKDEVLLGDVVAADYVDYYEFLKMTPKGLFPRRLPYDHPSKLLFHDYARPLMTLGNWHQGIALKPPETATRPPRLHIGNVLCGEKVLGRPEDEFQREIVGKFDKSLCVEMEGFGLARAVYESRTSSNYNPLALIVRGISDYVQDPQASEIRRVWTPFAAAAAASVVAQIVTNLLRTLASRASGDDLSDREAGVGR